jgi:hypothetical protein
MAQLELQARLVGLQELQELRELQVQLEQREPVDILVWMVLLEPRESLEQAVQLELLVLEPRELQELGHKEPLAQLGLEPLDQREPLELRERLVLSEQRVQLEQALLGQQE